MPGATELKENNKIVLFFFVFPTFVNNKFNAACQTTK